MKTTDDDPGAEIMPANRNARIAVALLFIIAIPAAVAITSWLDKPMKLDSPEDVRAAQERIELVLTIMTAMGLPMVIIAGFICRSALRIFAAGRYPAPGMWVLKDTPIVTGAKARTQGLVHLLMAIWLVIMAIGTPLVLWYLVATLL